jgi:hypothetical protein
MFATPEIPADRADWNDLDGRLIVFTVRQVLHEVPTKYGESDCVEADLFIVDGDEPDDESTLHRVQIFPRVLQQQLSPHVGGQLLGRLGKGKASGNQSAPWVLTPPTDEDIELATAAVGPDDGTPPF